MRDIFSLERTTEILRDDPYLSAYPHLVAFFSSKPSFEPSDVVCGAHMVYGWMPTVLELSPDPDNMDLESAGNLLTRAKSGGAITEPEVSSFVTLVNNSLVGASKLLHFVEPRKFAIWDSKVYSFVHQERPHHYRVNDVTKYFKYLEDLAALTQRDEFGEFYSSVQNKLGYPVSPLRALELIMFLNAPVYMS
jgi:hypothetical protein